MRKALVAVVVVLAMALPAFAANPFVDVPQNHWAYDALSQLSAKGVIQGYPDGTFKGQRPLTRYEFAVAIAKMLANVDATKASKEDVSMLKKLVVEFKDELDALGVKVDELAGKVDSLQKGLGGWRFSGEFRFDYLAKDDQDNTRKDKTDLTFSRARLVMTRQIDDKVSVTMRFNEGSAVDGSGGWDRFFVTAKMPYDITMRIGRFLIDYEGHLKDPYYESIFFDHNITGYEIKKDFGMGSFTVFYAWADDALSVGSTDALHVVRRASANPVGDRLDVNFMGARADLNLTENLRLGLFGYFWNVEKEGQAAKYSQPSALGLDFLFKFKNGVNFYGIYAAEDPDSSDVDNTNLWKVGVFVPQSILGNITSLRAEFFNADEGAFWVNDIYKSDNELGVLNGLVGSRPPKGESVSAFMLRLEQSWNPQWRTWFAYRGVTHDKSGGNDPKVTAFEAAIRYNYTKNMFMELLYENADYNAAAGKRDDSVVRFRTYVSF